MNKRIAVFLIIVAALAFVTLLVRHTLQREIGIHMLLQVILRWFR